MNLFFNEKLASKYSSLSQKVRIMTEDWVDRKIYCPNCGELNIDKYGNNQPVADFFCSNCREDYELKSKKESVGLKIVDGAYRTMIDRLRESNNPNLFLLNYELRNLKVMNFFVIPKHFFVPAIIEKRRPLSPNARRAGWTGCNILLENIPQTGKIFFVRNGQAESKSKVIAEWQKTLFLREEKEIQAKGWLLDVMSCIERFGNRKFTLGEVYAFENSFTKKHPDNKHIKDKIRQQLQILRDRGYLKFINRGEYKLT